MIHVKKPPLFSEAFGDSYENRTRVSAVRGRRLSRLTKEPYWLLPFVKQL